MIANGTGSTGEARVAREKEEWIRGEVKLKNPN